MFDLSGKVALVTGAGSGIGRAIALRFAQAGAKVFVGDFNSAEGVETVVLITATGGPAESAVLDVTDEAAADALAMCTGSVDVLVNNADIGHVGAILQTTGEDLDRLCRVNVRGVFSVTKAYIGDMIARRLGCTEVQPYTLPIAPHGVSSL